MSIHVNNQAAGLVTIIIPCYKQAHFLDQSIESVFAQSYKNIEVIVIDDGSPDNTAEVASRYSGVRYIRQENQGLSGARNTGIRSSKGDYIVFLDADDRLLPEALQQGLVCCAAHPDSVLASGHLRYINGDGSLLREYPPEKIDPDPYSALLKRNYIELPATVLYRRAIFDKVGVFNSALKSCEDYDLYLRIARRFPIQRHDHIIAEYRWHEANMSRNAARMLHTALAVLRAQRSYIQDKPHYIIACRDGVRFWRSYFLGRILERARAVLRARAWRQLIREVTLLARFGPPWATALWMDIDLTLAALRYRGAAQEKRA
jgi:glycosyltransferase involved in cell wall biosynthesis